MKYLVCAQVAELQNILAGLHQQVAAEQAMRRNDAQVRAASALPLAVAVALAANVDKYRPWATRKLAHKDAPPLNNFLQAFDYNLKNMESQLLAAQDAIVKRTIGMMESKAQLFTKAMQDLDAVTQVRSIPC